MILTIDIGNSRIKWALWRDGVITVRGVADYELDKAESGFTALFSAVAKPSRVLAVCVAGDIMRQALAGQVMQHWQLEVEYLKTQKRFNTIVNAYRNPAQHGADRWAAVVAAQQNFPDVSLCVISAGTAITFDLVAKNGRHLGGYILPSYATMHAGLHADTADVRPVFDGKYADLHDIPDNTDDAVNQGLHKLLQAGIRELCQFSQDKMDETMQIIVTGGFAKTILCYPDMPAMHHEPDLIMQGLYIIMNQQKNAVDS